MRKPGTVPRCTGGTVIPQAIVARSPTHSSSTARSVAAGVTSRAMQRASASGGTTLSATPPVIEPMLIVVAPLAEARCMARLVTPAETLRAVLEAWVGDRATITWGITVPPVHLATAPGFRTDVVAYATDIPVLTRWGRPYLFGPGSIHFAHTDDEHVDVAELRAAVDAYERLAAAALDRA